MTALDSSSKTTSRAQMPRTAARHQDADPSLWEEVKQGHSMQVLPFVFQRAVETSKAFQVTVKNFTLLILLSCSSVPPFPRIFLVNSHSEGIFLGWKNRKGFTLTPEPAVFHSPRKGPGIGPAPRSPSALEHVLGEERSRNMLRFIFSRLVWGSNSFCKLGSVRTAPKDYLRESRIPLGSDEDRAQSLWFIKALSGLCDLAWPVLFDINSAPCSYFSLILACLEFSFYFLFILSLTYSMIILSPSSLASEAFPGTTAQGCK